MKDFLLKDIPIKKVKKLDAEKSLDYCLDQIQRIKTDQELMVTADTAAENYYKSGKLGNEVKGRSQIVTSDVHDAVEGAIPLLMKVFAGTDEPVKIKPQEGTDQANADLMMALVNHQLRVRNNWFLTCYDGFHDALLLRRSVIKYAWENKTEEYVEIHKGLTRQEMSALGAQPNVKEIAIIASTETAAIPEVGEEENRTYDVEVTSTSETEGPTVRTIALEEIGFSRTASSFENISFMYHRVALEKWEFKKLYPDADAEELEAAGSSSESLIDTIKQERFADLGGTSFFWNDKEQKFIVHECYYTDPDTGTPLMNALCGNTVLELTRNKYDVPPFVILNAYKRPHRVIGMSIYDKAKHNQRNRSMLLRGLMDYINFSNSGRNLVDEKRVNMDDYLNRNYPAAAIRVVGDQTTAITPLPTTPIQPWTFTLLEFLTAAGENKLGITRMSSGVQGASTNKTKGGLLALMAAGGQKLELITRVLAETGIAPLIMAMVKMNLKFMSKPAQIRVLGKPMTINPDNIAGEYDVIVNVGVGTGDNDERIVQAQQLLAIFKQVFEAKIPVVTAENLYHALKNLLLAMDKKDYEMYITEPKTVETLAQIAAMMPQVLPVIAQIDPVMAQQMQQFMASMGMMAKGAPGAQPGGIQQSPREVRPPEQPAQPAVSSMPMPQGPGMRGQ